MSNRSRKGVRIAINRELVGWFPEPMTNSLGLRQPSTASDKKTLV